MIDLGIVLALQDSGIGTYGTDLWVNQSPILNNGAVGSKRGIFVNSNGASSSGDSYSDMITISVREEDILAQSIVLARLNEWARSLSEDCCSLPLRPLVEFDPIQVVSISDRSAATTAAIDNEGRFVKEITFMITYKLPALS